MLSKNSKRIALITTGGTISSALSGGVISGGKVDIAGFFNGFNFVKNYAPLSILSENLEFADLLTINAALKKCIEETNPDGVIITHGTDTLAYTAAFLSLVNTNINIPAVLVSADYPLDNPLSNGLTNMKAAIEFINFAGSGGKKCGGVFVSYCNKNENAKIHFGSRLNVTRGFDGYVSSANDRLCAEFTGGYNFTFCQKPITAGNIICPYADNIINSKVMLLTPYVGIDYAALNDFSQKNSLTIVHDSYHSGTVKTDKENNINCLKGEVFLAGGQKGDKYASLLNLNPNIKVYDNITPLALYFKVILSAKMSKAEREKYLAANTANEYF